MKPPADAVARRSLPLIALICNCVAEIAAAARRRLNVARRPFAGDRQQV